MVGQGILCFYIIARIRSLGISEFMFISKIDLPFFLFFSLIVLKLIFGLGVRLSQNHRNSSVRNFTLLFLWSGPLHMP